MSRVVVTGGAGYIGSHAVRALVDAGHEVAVLDDLSAGHAQAVPAGVTLVQAAIHDRDAVHGCCVEHRADAVMHFAAWLAVGESVQQAARVLPEQRRRHARRARRRCATPA